MKEKTEQVQALVWKLQGRTRMAPKMYGWCAFPMTSAETTQTYALKTPFAIVDSGFFRLDRGESAAWHVERGRALRGHRRGDSTAPADMAEGWDWVDVRARQGIRTQEQRW
jgi:hypothetical protein